MDENTLFFSWGLHEKLAHADGEHAVPLSAGNFNDFVQGNENVIVDFVSACSEREGGREMTLLLVWRLFLPDAAATVKVIDAMCAYVTVGGAFVRPLLYSSSTSTVGC